MKTTHEYPQYAAISIDAIADALATREWIAVENFLNPTECLALLQCLEEHREGERFRKAGIGHGGTFLKTEAVRGDYIKWINPGEALPATQVFLARIRTLMTSLNSSLFLSLKDFECHYAIYPPGSFYKKHLDQFQDTSFRKISFAFYLNENWEAKDGGALRIYREEGIVDVAPILGRLALFRSDTVAHEVLPTHRDRYSITGWMRDQPLNVPFFRN